MKWFVPLVWTMYGSLVVEAETEEEAACKAIIGSDFPKNASFLDGTMEVDGEIVPAIKLQLQQVANSDELCEAFCDKVRAAVQEDDEKPVRVAKDIISAMLSNDANGMFLSITGASLERLIGETVLEGGYE